MRLVISTAPPEVAPIIARSLVEEKLAACVNIAPAGRSVYVWKGEVCDDEESVLFMKTTERVVGPLCERLKEIHPYDVPEIIVLDIRDDEGNFDYHAWLRESVER